jgi:nicotinamidase-related amidase
MSQQAPLKTALLIIDMQKIFLPMTTICLPNILSLSSFFTSHAHSASGLVQIFTQHGHTTEELSPPFPNQLVRKWGVDGSIHRFSKNWELIPEVEDIWKKAGETSIIQKNTYDAFLNTDLEARLEKEGIERVIITGVMTDCCCDTTGRSAFNRGFETWMVRDGTGSANKKQHEAGLRGFGFAFGEVLDTEEVLEWLREEVN